MANIIVYLFLSYPVNLAIAFILPFFVLIGSILISGFCTSQSISTRALMFLWMPFIVIFTIGALEIPIGRMRAMIEFKMIEKQLLVDADKTPKNEHQWASWLISGDNNYFFYSPAVQFKTGDDISHYSFSCRCHQNGSVIRVKGDFYYFILYM